jgi:AraC-like DNA-binding protein
MAYSSELWQFFKYGYPTFEDQGLGKTGWFRFFRAFAHAAVCRVSLRQLERHFERQFHQTPTKWVRVLRCRVAVNLLRLGYSTKAVAAELQYANSSQFCHDFRKECGCSPNMHPELLYALLDNNVAQGQSLDVVCELHPCENLNL